MKPIISLFILVAIILALNTITLLNTKNTIENLNKALSNLEESIDKYENEKILDNIKNVENSWKKYKETLSFYIEHEELEKVESEIVASKSNVENEEYETAKEDIARAKFLLDHIKEKNELKLKNIF